MLDEILMSKRAKWKIQPVAKWVVMRFSQIPIDKSVAGEANRKVEGNIYK